MKLFKSSRGGNLLEDDDGYEYKIGYKASSGQITWRCNNTEFRYCHGSVRTPGLNSPITKVKEHDHEPSMKTKVKQIMRDVSLISKDKPEIRPLKIIHAAHEGIDPELANMLPSYSTLRQRVLRSRKSKRQFDTSIKTENE